MTTRNPGRSPVHIMAIGAHIGDMELSCGKTLATHSLLGDRITTVALTAGERGAPPEADIAAFRAENVAAASSFAAALGGRFIDIGYPDGEVPDDEEVRYRVADLIRELRPDILITHWRDGLHKDHRRTARIVRDAHYYAALRGFERSAPRHAARGPYYAENWEDAPGFEPYIYIDVSPGYGLWYEHVQKLWLTNNSPWFQYRAYYDALSRSRGALIHRERAECFAVEPEQRRLVLEHF